MLQCFVVIAVDSTLLLAAAQCLHTAITWTMHNHQPDAAALTPLPLRIQRLPAGLSALAALSRLDVCEALRPNDIMVSFE